MNGMDALKALAALAHDLRHSADLIDEGIEKKGAYKVDWGTLSWSRDMARRGADRIAEIIGPVCPQCDGLGFHPNPNAHYAEDNETGQYVTIDPEEVDCDKCGGLGFVEPEPAPPAKPTGSAVFKKIELDDDLPF